MKKVLLILALSIISLNATPIKEFGKFNQIRNNFLTGKGLVMGLNGSGDKSFFSKKALQNVLNKSGFTLTEKDITTKNIALTLLSAKLPTFSTKGTQFDVTVATIGDAASLENGELLLTYLKDSRGNVFATCQGHIKVEDQDNPTKGTIKNGCIVEREINYKYNNSIELVFTLDNGSFKRVLEIEEKINEKYGFRKVAVALDNRNIKLNKPEEESAVRFSYNFLNFEIEDKEKIVIIDLNNKILVGGEDIVLKPVQILTDDLSIKIKAAEESDIDRQDSDIKDRVVINLKLGLIKKQKTKPILGDLIRGLQQMGFKFEKIVDIIKVLKKKGSISNDIEYI